MKKNIVVLIIGLFSVSACFFLSGYKNSEAAPSLGKALLQALRAISSEFVRFSGDSEESFCAEINQSSGLKIHREIAKPIIYEKAMGTTRIRIEKDGEQLYSAEIPGQYHLAGYYGQTFELLTYQLFPDGGFIRASGLTMIDIKSGQRRKIGPAGNFQYASLSPDGRHCLLVADDLIEVVSIPEGNSYQVPVEGIAQVADPWIKDQAGGSVNLSGDFMEFQWSNALTGKLVVKDQGGKTIKAVPLTIKENEMGKELTRRKRLIAAAVAKMKMQGFADFEAALFPVIKVRESEDDLYVSFGRKIYFFPLNSVYLYGAMVRFEETDKGAAQVDKKLRRGPAVLSFKIEENPEDMEYDREKVKCFVMTQDLKEKFDFVIEAINRSDEVGSLDPKKAPDNFEMVIWERADHYEISIDYQYHSFYKIKKNTGQIYDAGHKHYVEEPKEGKRVCWEVVDFELFNQNVRLVTPGMQKEQVLELIGKPAEEKGNVWLYRDLEGWRMPESGEQLFSAASITFKGEFVEKIDLSWMDATGAGKKE